jgi:hypothetical protein
MMPCYPCTSRQIRPELPPGIGQCPIQSRTLVLSSCRAINLFQLGSLRGLFGCALTIAVVVVSPLGTCATALAMRFILVPFSVFKDAANNGSASRQSQAKQKQQGQSACGFHCFSGSSETLTCIGSIASILSPSGFTTTGMGIFPFATRSDTASVSVVTEVTFFNSA